MADTKVAVHVVSGRNLPAADTNGLCDPYCCLSVELGQRELYPKGKSFQCKTHTIKKNRNPTWGEYLDLNSHKPNEETLRLYIFDHDTFSTDDFLAWGEVPIKEIVAAGGKLTKDVKLIDAKGLTSEAGTIRLEITYGDPTKPQQPPPQQQQPQQQQPYYPPPQQGYYPPPQGYYPPQQGYYPPPQGYYPPPQQGNYPPPQGYYPPQQQQGYYPPPQQQGYYPPPQQPPLQQPPLQQPPLQQPPLQQPPQQQQPPAPQLDPETVKVAQRLGIHDDKLNEAWLKFQQVDTDRSGSINLEELKALLHMTLAKQMQPDVLDRYARVELSSVDKDRSGTVNFQEFLAIFAKLQAL